MSYWILWAAMTALPGATIAWMAIIGWRVLRSHWHTKGYLAAHDEIREDHEKYAALLEHLAAEEEETEAKPLRLVQ